MKLISSQPLIVVELTRRNLQALLAKLDEPDSFRTLYKGNLAVRAVEDDAHYSDRAPGPMSKETEATIKEMRG